MDCVEGLIREIVHHLHVQKCIEGSHIDAFLALDQIPKISMEEALYLCTELEGTSKKILPGVYALTKEGEQYLTTHVFKGPVWVTHLPRMSVPFYQAFEKETALCADLLMGSGEVVGCGERITDPRLIIQSLRDHQVDWEDYAWYIKMKAEKSLRTSGFGMGIERFLLWLFDHNDIRDIPIFPRLKGVPANP
jgi:aspartyl/asparaginyl-tRNA synthetase